MGSNGTGLEIKKTGIVIRALPPEEWGLGPGPHAWPPDTIVIGAFREEELIGRMAIITLPHLEAVWIKEAYRGGDVLSRLAGMIHFLLKYIGRTHAFAFSYDQQPEIGNYLGRLGYEKQPLTVWVKELE